MIELPKIILVTKTDLVDGDTLAQKVSVLGPNTVSVSIYDEDQLFRLKKFIEEEVFNSK